jgi:general secretion pathway protein A
MFLEQYNLLVQPFEVTPDTRFLYLNHMYREALASLWYGIEQRRGFMVLIAHPGMGKTTLLFQLLQRLRRTSARTVFLFQTCCSSHDFIRYLLLDLGIWPSTDPVIAHYQLTETLFEGARAGRQLVLVIDEAQNLNESTLESVRLLSNFETTQGKLMQIILAGQPQLVNTLMRPEMLQLTQRLAVTSFLDPLDEAEVERYIRHRLGVAGYQGRPLFTDDALQVVARESRGIPRNINNICFGALSMAFALHKKQVDRKIVEEVAGEQNLRSLGQRVSPQRPKAQSKCDPIVPDFKGLRTERVSLKRGLIPSSVGSYLRGAACLVAFLFAVPLQQGPSESRVPVLSAERRLVATLTNPVPATFTTKQEFPSTDTLPATQADLPTAFPDNRVIIVQQGQTLRQICLTFLGRFSPQTVQQVKSLNPDLNPNRLEIGQQIRLPERSAKGFMLYPKPGQIAVLGK